MRARVRARIARLRRSHAICTLSVSSPTKYLRGAEQRVLGGQALCFRCSTSDDEASIAQDHRTLGPDYSARCAGAGNCISKMRRKPCSAPAATSSACQITDQRRRPRCWGGLEDLRFCEQGVRPGNKKARGIHRARSEMCVRHQLHITLFKGVGSGSEAGLRRRLGHVQVSLHGKLPGGLPRIFLANAVGSAECK